MDKFISNIKKRLEIMREAISAVRVLHNSIVMIGKSLFIDMKTMQAHWDSDRRPEIRGEVIQYFSVDSTNILTEKHTLILLESLTIEELATINCYLQIMVPRPMGEDVILHNGKAITYADGRDDAGADTPSS